MSGRRRVPLVEILYFDGCPNYERALRTAERIAAELGLDPEIRLVDVPDLETAEKLRFPGSPTVRVGGRDVEPGSEERGGHTLACRVYRTPGGLAGEPSEVWVRAALLRESGETERR